MLSWLGVLAASYLLGGIPFPLLVGRMFKGVDIRTQGSGNMGANNVRRLLGWSPAILTFLLDALKGAAAVVIALRLSLGAPGGEFQPLVAGLVAMVGHTWPVYAGFKGGKGLATGAGALMAWNPVVGIQVSIGAAIYRAIFKDTVRTAVAASWTVPALAYLHSRRWDVTAVAALYAVFVTWRHWSLLTARMAAGKGGGKDAPPPSAPVKQPPQSRGIPRSVMINAMKKGGRRRR